MVIVLNSIALVTCIMLHMDCFYKLKNKWETALIFFALALVDIMVNTYFESFSKMELSLIIVFVALYTGRIDNSYKSSVLFSINILFYIQTLVMIYSALWFYVLSSLFDGSNWVFNVYMQAGLIGTTLMIRKYRKVFYTTDMKFEIAYWIDLISKLVLMGLIFYFLPAIKESMENQAFFLFILLCIVFMVCLKIAIEYMYKTENKNAILRIKNEAIEENSQIIIKKYEDIAYYKHLYMELFKSFKFLTEEKVKNLDAFEPICSKLIVETEQTDCIQKINCPLIRSLLLETFNNAKGIQFNVEMKNEIELLPIQPYDLFSILKLLLERSVGEAMESENRFVNVIMYKQLSCFIFQIENSTLSEEQKHQLSYEIAKKLTENYSTVRINSYFDGDRHIQKFEVDLC